MTSLLYKDIMDIIVDYKNSMEDFDIKKLKMNKEQLERMKGYYGDWKKHHLKPFEGERMKKKYGVERGEKLEDNIRILNKNIMIYEKRLNGEYNRIDSKREIIKLKKEELKKL